MPQYSQNEKVDVLFDNGRGRQPALIVRNATPGSRGLGAMPLVRITRPGSGPYKGVIRAHADLITPRRTLKRRGQ
jgi:hypothetical protein